MKTAYSYLAAVLLSVLFVSAARAQESSGGKIRVQFVDAPLNVILSEFESISGFKVIRDGDIENVKMSVETVEAMDPDSAMEFIEKTLLLNGFALLGTENPEQLKIVGFTGNKHPRSEGVPLIKDEADLPPNEQIVMYVMKFDHLNTADAKAVLESAFPLHPYGNIAPVPGRDTLVVTESSLVVRQMLDLRDVIDVPEDPFSGELFCLERIDATSASEILTNMFAQGTGGGGTAGAAAPTAAANPIVFQAVARNNSILVKAPPKDLPIIAKTIAKLDSPGPQFEVERRKLNYLAVDKFLQIAQDSLFKSRDASSGSSGGVNGGDNLNRTQNLQTTNNTTNSSTGGSSLSADLGTAGFEEESGPISIVVDNTVLIGDVTNNTLLVKGPCEDVDLIMELVETMDIRPKQIQLTAIIAQLTLDNGFQFGVDLVRTLQGETGRQGAGLFSNRALNSTLNSQSIVDIGGALATPESFVPATSGLTLYGQLNPHLNSYITTLESTSRFRVLSRPTVYTLNNQRAVIQTGQRIAVPRSTLSTVDPGAVGANQIVTAAIDFEEVVLRVEVLPLINSEDEITLSIKQTNDDIVGSQTIGGNSIPTIGTQALGTKIIVKDGSAVLLGGLISEQDNQNKSGLPVFVNLPLVGKYFGATNRARERQELLIFIQPRIIDSDMSHLDVDSRLGEGALIQSDPRSEFFNLDNQQVDDSGNKGLQKIFKNKWRWKVNRE